MCRYEIWRLCSTWWQLKNFLYFFLSDKRNGIYWRILICQNLIDITRWRVKSEISNRPRPMLAHLKVKTKNDIDIKIVDIMMNFCYIFVR